MLQLLPWEQMTEVPRGAFAQASGVQVCLLWFLDASLAAAATPSGKKGFPSIISALSPTGTIRFLRARLQAVPQARHLKSGFSP
jgi:hypothetical protein